MEDQRGPLEKAERRVRLALKQELPGAVIAIQTFGAFLGFNPHCHILCTDRCFYGNGVFRVSPEFDIKELEKLFRYKILKILL